MLRKVLPKDLTLTYALMEFAHDAARHLSADTLFLSRQLATVRHAPFLDNQGDKRKAITSETFPRNGECVIGGTAMDV